MPPRITTDFPVACAAHFYVGKINSPVKASNTATWIEDRLLELAGAFAIDIAAYAVKILTGWDFGAHGAPYYDTYFP